MPSGMLEEKERISKKDRRVASSAVWHNSSRHHHVSDRLRFATTRPWHIRGLFSIKLQAGIPNSIAISKTAFYNILCDVFFYFSCYIYFEIVFYCGTNCLSNFYYCVAARNRLFLLAINFGQIRTNINVIDMNIEFGVGRSCFQFREKVGCRPRSKAGEGISFSNQTRKNKQVE